MMTFVSHRGVIAALDRANVDTDQIIPKQFLKSISRTGFGAHLFHDWRYRPDGAPDPEFPLNAPAARGASILVTRHNFGCGSSREHAVWAIQQYGIRVLLAPARTPEGGVAPQERGAPARREGGASIPAFADIFRNNCVKNGLLTVELSEAEVNEIIRMVERFPGLEASVDLEHQRVVLHVDEELAFHFDIDAPTKDHLIRGLDDIGLTLDHEAEIAAFEARHDAQWSPGGGP
ncbi:MAG TPA: 3-isopropylmalate dehydratase small subunit [bacterium]